MQRIVILLMALFWTTACSNSMLTNKTFTKPEANVLSEKRTATSQQETENRRLYGRAFTFLRAMKYSKALDVFDQILISNPRDADALYYRANVLALLNRKPEAMDSLRSAIETGFIDFAVFTRNPGMLALSSEKAFADIMQEYDVVLQETHSPSVASIKRILAEPRFHRFLPRLLPRYRANELTGDTLRLLDSQDLQLQRCAVVSLLHQNADTPSVRARVAEFFASPDAEIREAVAEYFLWHGTMAEREILVKAAALELDPFTRSAEQAGVELIDTRDRWMSSLTETYRLGWSFEPKLVYEGMKFDERTLSEQRNRFNMATAIFRFRHNPSSETETRSEDLPVANSFMAPVRDFFDPWRQSFGVFTGNSGSFKNTVHCGDDVAWYVDDGTVVSIADGVVRMINHVYSWGVIVIIEHRLPKKEGYCCSLYGHLAPSVSVAVGQIVRKGQRIAAVGRSYTWENGGYSAHLHFGLHQGPYLQRRNSSQVDMLEFDESMSVQDITAASRKASGTITAKPDNLWITGYLNPKIWAAGRHGWVNPQQFINKRK